MAEVQAFSSVAIVVATVTFLALVVFVFLNERRPRP